MACPLLPGFSATATIVHLHPVRITVFGCGSFGFSASLSRRLRDVAPFPGRVCLSPRSGRKLFLRLPGVWLESSRWGHPDGSSLCQFSIGTKTLHAPSLGVGAVPSWWGHTYRVVYRISAHLIGTKASSIHLSLVARLYSFRMGSPFSGLDLTIWSRVKEFLWLGSWERFSGPSSGWALSSFGRLVGSEAGRVPHSAVFASSGVSVCVPLAGEGVGLGRSSSSGPVASRSPLPVRSASAASSSSGGGCRPGWFR